MRLSCINKESNHSAVELLLQFNKEAKKLQHKESVYYAEAVEDFLGRLATEEKIISAEMLNKGLSHLLKSRKILMILDTKDERVLNKLDNLIEQTIIEIDKNLLYLINPYKGVH